MYSDTYHTLENDCFGEFKEKGSRFLSYGYFFSDEIELSEKLQNLHTMHPKAVHFCFAYKIGLDDHNFRYNDDGEPSGSAGRPIYNQILSHKLSNVLMVVVRYFGGTKLGVPGLIQAYKEATKIALSSASIIEKQIEKEYLLSFKYEEMGFILDLVKKNDLYIKTKQFEDVCSIIISIRKSMAEQKIKKLKADLLNISLEYVNETTEVPYCSIEELKINNTKS